MGQSMWEKLEARGVSRSAIKPALGKLLGPPATIAKPQFREAFLKEVAAASKKRTAQGEIAELFLLADAIWESWPKLDPS